MRLELGEYTGYQRAVRIANQIWKLVEKWDKLAQFTIGTQVVRSIDSVSANLAEGWNKPTKKNRLKYYHIALGSLVESQDWLEKSFERNLIDKKIHDECANETQQLLRQIRHLIASTQKNLKY